jgi:hypothetical protein
MAQARGEAFQSSPAREPSRPRPGLFLSFAIGLLGLASSTGELIRALITASGIGSVPENVLVSAMIVSAALFLLHLIGTIRSIILASKLGKA